MPETNRTGYRRADGTWVRPTTVRYQGGRSVPTAAPAYSASPDDMAKVDPLQPSRDYTPQGETHAEQRISERLHDAGYSDKAISQVWGAVRILEDRLPKDKDVAVRILKLPSQVNETWGDRSNGDCLWAIYREGKAQTVMLRRSTQPSTNEALRVDRVLFLGDKKTGDSQAA